MAKMIPFELCYGDYLSEGEKEVFDGLKDQLSDEWTVIYSLRWVTQEEVFINKSNGECDFLVLNPDYGVLVVEVKGGIVSFHNQKWTSINHLGVRKDISDPEKQTNDSKHELVSILKKNNVRAYITTAVWFPDTDIQKSSLPLSLPREVILDMNSFDNIEKRLIEVFKFRMSKESFLPKKMLLNDFNRLLQVLNPKVSFKIPLKRIGQKLNTLYIKLNEEQSRVFEQLEDNNFISVKGHAGTGKTVLAVKKALKDSTAGKKVLYLCYNNKLCSKVKEDSQGAFNVNTIHDYALEFLNRFHPELVLNFENEPDYDKLMCDFTKKIKGNQEKNLDTYDTVLVDEGQDFTKEWFESVKSLVKPDGQLCAFYDELQMLYEDYGRNDISFLDFGVKYNLKRNMRNTDEICKSSINIMNIAEDKVILNGIKGLRPQLLVVDNFVHVFENLKRTIDALLLEEQIKAENITVLTIQAKNKLKYKKELRNYCNVEVESVRKFKGLENDIIIIPDLNHDFLQDKTIRKLLYVAMSRARVHVILLINAEALSRKQKAGYKKEIEDMLR
jgi:DNA helicase IV